VKNRLYIILIPLILGAILYACANTKSVAKVHPTEVKGLVDCGECHTDNWAALNHQADDFYRKHKFYAGQQKFACQTCHQESFCADCHAHKEEIKPSDKYKTSPERQLPHRGDYLSRHKIEGRIDPASCLKCHGRTNNERCKTCHR
jgi:hypothetical protein